MSKFNVKISVIPNGLEKCMAFAIDKNLFFIDSMLFMNSSLDKLVKHLSDKDFKYLSEEYSGEQLKLVKEKRIYPYEYMNSFKKFNENKLPDKNKFFTSVKDNNTIMYCDANNLYDWAIIQPLPVIDFNFLTEKKLIN